MNRVSWEFAYFRKQIGWVGLIAIAGFVTAFIYGLTVLNPSEKSLSNARQTLSAAKAAYRSDNLQSEPVVEKPEAELQRFIAYFPDVDSVNDTWEQLAKLSEDASLAIDHTHYDSSNNKRAGLLSYRLNIPVKAPYPQIRNFLASVVESSANIAIESLTFKRDNVESPVVGADMTLVIYVRAP